MIDFKPQGYPLWAYVITCAHADRPGHDHPAGARNQHDGRVLGWVYTDNDLWALIHDSGYSQTINVQAAACRFFDTEDTLNAFVDSMTAASADHHARNGDPR